MFPLDVRTVRYETMVEDLESALRPLFDWLGFAWDAAALDHSRTAKARGHIRSASYAQVAEPIYRHAAGRWERYREQLAPILPMLAPWAAKMGYAV